MTADGQRKLFAILLALLGLALFGIVKFAPLPHRPTPTSAVLLGIASCLLFAAARVVPTPESDVGGPGPFSRWANGRIVLMFAATLFVLGYGLWAIFTGSL